MQTSATFSATSSGLRSAFSPGNNRLNISVSTLPGHNATILTLLTSSAADSVRHITANFDAQYAPSSGIPSQILRPRFPIYIFLIPSLASLFAIYSPIPLPLPVTITLLFSSFIKIPHYKTPCPHILKSLIQLFNDMYKYHYY